MEQRISFITLGVDNLQAMKEWYTEKLGWTPEKTDSEGIVFFHLNGCILGLYPATELAADIGVPAAGSGFRRVTLAHNLRSEAEVDALFAALEARNVQIVKRPEKVFWGGYSGYIADPEGNYWELAYNPFALPDNDGNMPGHK